MMPPPRTRGFRSILCAVDFSPQSAKALRYAVALARASGGRVTAIHAVDPRLTAAAAAAATGERWKTTRARISSGSCARPCAARRPSPFIRSPGSARRDRSCVEYARHKRGVIIVLGTHGHHGVAKLYFGSTTEAVLRRFRGPVLAIPPHCREPRPAWPGGSLVAAIDERTHLRATISAAARIAEAIGGWLSLAPAAPATARRRSTRLILLPLPAAARLRMLRQGSAAYRFVCAARSPVLMLRTGTRVGTVVQVSRAA